MNRDRTPALIGVDTGGTFTDFVLITRNGIRVHKERSSPDDPSRAILRGIEALCGEAPSDVIHGSTVATNAILERRGARVVMLTTEGLEDVIEIGRQARTSIYDPDVRRPEPLVARADRIGVVERKGPDGITITPLADNEMARVVRLAAERGGDSVVVCLLHSYADPEHEHAIVRALGDESKFVFASTDVAPEFREYERFSTTVVNAYVAPLMSDYLVRLEKEPIVNSVRVMQSSGGITSATTARTKPVGTVLSGPAGGVVGAQRIAAAAGYDNVITFDMGGTSTDVSLCHGAVRTAAESSIAGFPLRIPMIDIHTVGAGGGSIAFCDAGGALRVGPRSAGAVPGPMCYGSGGTEPTVTDANMVLGRISPDHFLGGEARLNVGAAIEGMEKLGARLGLSTTEAAEGIVTVANATMERALRVISLERGYDPREFTLVCFGGAGGLHAAALARSLRIPRVLVPDAAGVLSAHGLLLSDFLRDFSQTVLTSASRSRIETLESSFHDLEQHARAECGEDGYRDVSMERSIDMRYAGQGFELQIPYGADIEARFHEMHARRYGYSDANRTVELVTLRVRARQPVSLQTSRPAGIAARRRHVETRIVFSGELHNGQIMAREELASGDRVDGPAVITEYSTTTIVPPDYLATVDDYGNLILARNE